MACCIKGGGKNPADCIDLTSEDGDEEQALVQPLSKPKSVRINTDVNITYKPDIVNIETTSHQRKKRKRLERGNDDEICVAARTLCPTKEMFLLESNHGQERRKQRKIGLVDLKAVLKYGVRTEGRQPNTSRYTYKGTVLIRDDITGREITSFTERVHLSYWPVTVEERETHEISQTIINSSFSSWTSHSVIIVDASGSMRNADVGEERSRIGAVWFSLAEDFVKQRIQSGTSSPTDVVTIILMGEEAEVMLEHQPVDWVLYNRIATIYNEDQVIPSGHGNYIPAIEKAEEILNKNNSHSCALNLTLLSDGKPSDKFYFNYSSHRVCQNAIMSKISNLASKFGRRLTFATIGMGSIEQFDTLKNISSLVKEYGCNGLFQLPSLSRSKLGNAFTSISTALTETRIEMTSFAYPLKQKTVRNVKRDKQSSISVKMTRVNKKDFNIFSSNDVCRLVYKNGDFKQDYLQSRLARGVAMRKTIFAEGCERFAYQFFEIGADNETIVGTPLVAKECRFVEDFEDRENFVKKFCKLQSQAAVAAKAFNKKLDEIKRLHPKTPRISFLDCSVYYINNADSGEEAAILVEKKLEGEFLKWNSNNGKIFGEDIRVSENVICQNNGDRDVFVIEEDLDYNENECIKVTHDDVAQAFSHFSYNFTNKKMLICDLQGIFDESQCSFIFTDPVIHYYDNQRTEKNVYGRTDRGRRGIDEFFQTHKCSPLCKLVELGFRCVRT